MYKVLCKPEPMHWFCKNCNTGVLKTLQSIEKMMDRENNIENRLAAMQNETKRHRSRSLKTLKQK